MKSTKKEEACDMGIDYKLQLKKTEDYAEKINPGLAIFIGYTAILIIE